MRKPKKQYIVSYYYTYIDFNQRLTGYSDTLSFLIPIDRFIDLPGLCYKHVTDSGIEPESLTISKIWSENIE